MRLLPGTLLFDTLGFYYSVTFLCAPDSLACARLNLKTQRFPVEQMQDALRAAKSGSLGANPRDSKVRPAKNAQPDLTHQHEPFNVRQRIKNPVQRAARFLSPPLSPLIDRTFFLRGPRTIRSRQLRFATAFQELVQSPNIVTVTAPCWLR
jgi:hypothetical protein